MKVGFPDILDDFSLAQSRIVRNTGVDANSLALDDIPYLLDEIERKLGTNISPDPNSLDGRLSAIERTVSALSGDSLSSVSGTGSANQVLGLDGTGANHEYKTLSGTANQITITHAAGSITFSMPAAVSIQNLTLTGADALAIQDFINPSFDGLVGYDGVDGVAYAILNVASGSVLVSAGTTTAPTWTTSPTFTALTLSGTSGNILTCDTNVLVVDATNNRVGIGTASPGYFLHVVGTDSLVTAVFSELDTDATPKNTRIGAGHYTNSEEPMAIVMADSGSTTSILYWGGGTGLMNAATIHSFYTAANNTTLSGTERLRVNNSGAIINGYLNVANSIAAPTNATAGDLTVKRYCVGLDATLSSLSARLGRVGENIDETASAIGSYYYTVFTPVADLSATHNIITIDTRLAGSYNYIRTLTPFISYIRFQKTGTSGGTYIAGQFEGVRIGTGESNFTSGGTPIALRAYPVDAFGTNTGTFANSFGVRVENSTVGSGPITLTSVASIAVANHTTATNNTNLLLGTLTIPTGDWSIYNASTYANYFAGDFGLNVTPTSQFHQVQGVKTSGSPTAFKVTVGAHTTLAAGVEMNDVHWDFSPTAQFATGAITLLRTMYIDGRTYGFVGASTISDAATLYVDAPVAGTNATITNAWAIYSNGRCRASLFSPSSATAAAPGFMLSTGVGMYLTGGNIGFSHGSALVASLNGTALTMLVPVYSAAGTVSAPGYAFTSDPDMGLWREGADQLGVATAGTERMHIDANGNVVINTAALATTATNGFLYITTAAGVPTGVPTTHTGRVAIHYDTTNNKLYVYNGAWKSVTLA